MMVCNKGLQRRQLLLKVWYENQLICTARRRKIHISFRVESILGATFTDVQKKLNLSPFLRYWQCARMHTN